VTKSQRKSTTPIPVQVAAFVRDRRSREPFSAKDVYDTIDHPANHDKKSRVGNINKALVRLWSEDALCSFLDADNHVLREAEFVEPGSAAVEHPQKFALPGSKAPHGYRAVSYAEANAVASKSEVVKPPATESEVTDAAGSELAQHEPDQTEGRHDAASGLEERARSGLTEPAPDWIPDALMLDWVTRRYVVGGLRAGLDKADEQERRQLIMTGLQRKGGMPTADSQVARALVKLCRRYAVWWDRVSYWAYKDDADSGDVLGPDDLEALEADYALELADQYDPGVVVLTAVRLGIDNDAVRLLAETADAGQTASPTRALEDALAEIRTQLDLANSDLREARAAERSERQARTAAEKQANQLRTQLEQTKASAKKQGESQEHEANLRAQLAEALEGAAELAAAHEALAEERERLADAERDAAESEQALSQAEAELVTARDEVRRLRANEPALQDALRTIGELSVRLEAAEQRAGEVPIAQDARSLVGLLDSTIGRLVSEASTRISQGDATDEEQLLLAFASQFLQFKIALPEPVRETDENVEPAEPTLELVEPLTEEEALDEPPAVEADMEDEEPERPRRRRRARSGWTVKPIGGAGEIGASAIVAQTPSGETVLLDAGQRMPRLYGGAADYAYHFGVTGVERLDAIIVSHAHIDHTGSLPVLHRNVRGQLRMNNGLPVFMSEPTRELAELMMRDSAKIQHWNERRLEDVAETDLGGEFATGLKAAAYDDDDVTRVLGSVEVRDPRAAFEIPSTNIVARLEPVAHVLGSCAIHLTDTGTGATLLYTGDLGPIADSQLTLPDFGHTSMLSPAQMIVMESTYGERPAGAPPVGRLAKKSRRQQQIEKLHGLAKGAIDRGGLVLIPCFSLGRAQELARIIHQALNKELPDAPVYIGGMAAKILDIYDDYADRGDRGQGERWVRAGQFPRTQSLHRRVRDHLSFAEIAEEVVESGPGYILASPAVLSGGWSLTFAKRMVEDPKNAIIFTGFLPNDDRHSKRMSEFRTGDQVKLSERAQTIQADWDQVGLSAHATADDLRQFAQRMASQSDAPVSFGFVHGMPQSEEALARDVARMENVARAEPLQNNQVWAAAV
jgi:Cft2 family RNA processing exonuclease